MVKRPAFTLLELVMVIVIFGIVASIGADIISSMYQNYLRTRTINRLQAQTEITLEQIAKRLQYRVKESVIARNRGTGDLLPLSSSGVDGNFDVIEWIGYSNETFRGTNDPLWTGLIDLNPSLRPTLISPGSNFTAAGMLMDVLTNGDVDLTAGKEAALIFKRPGNPAEFGWGENNNTDGINALKVTQGANQDELTITSATITIPNEIYEHYYLAHTAYALVPAGNPTDFNLTLRYNYQPWLGGFYDNNTTTSTAVMAQNVRLFRFRQDANLIRLKLCLHDDNRTGIGALIVTCKEKVVF